MKIGIIGLGYVGLTTGLGFCELEHRVKGYDIDYLKINQLKQGKMPFYEQGLQEILEKSIKKNFSISKDLRDVLTDSDVIFICVPTPSNDDGSIDLSFMNEVAKGIGEEFKSLNKYPIISIKSTVIPGSTIQTGEIIADKSGLVLNKDFFISMVPEFLRQGNAYHDFKHPDRIIIGVQGEGNPADMCLKELFKPLASPIYSVDIESAEFSKYASNSFLALKISFANQLANTIDSFNLEKIGRRVDIDSIVELMGLDKRINPSFLGAGPGYGGSCFPKDVKALVAFSKTRGTPFTLLEETTKVNEKQSEIVLRHTKDVLGSFKDKRIGVIGLTFKANTDDIRVTPARSIIKTLLNEKATVFAWDPQGEEKMAIEFPFVSYRSFLDEFLKDNLDAAIIITDWPEVKEFLNKNADLPFSIIDTRRISKTSSRSIGRSYIV